jgi:hypothetical protein
VLVERSFCGQDADRHGSPGRGPGRGARTRGVGIIPDRWRPARGSMAALPTPRGARLHGRETIPRPTLLRSHTASPPAPPLILRPAQTVHSGTPAARGDSPWGPEAEPPPDSRLRPLGPQRNPDRQGVVERFEHAQGAGDLAVTGGKGSAGRGSHQGSAGRGSHRRTQAPRRRVGAGRASEHARLEDQADGKPVFTAVAEGNRGPMAHLSRIVAIPDRPPGCCAGVRSSSRAEKKAELIPDALNRKQR